MEISNSLPSSSVFLQKEFSYNHSVYKIERTHDVIFIFKKVNDARETLAEWDLFHQEGFIHLNNKEKRYKRLHHWKKAVEKCSGNLHWDDYFHFILPKPYLTIDPSFKPATRRHQNGEADEMFTHESIRWNITMMEEWIAENKDLVTMKSIDVSPDFVNYIQSGFITTNAEHVPHVDVNKPVIIVQLHPPFDRMSGERLIDGHHRMLKAFEEGVPTLEAYVLSIEQHLPFLMYTLDETYAYRTLIHSWNDGVELLIKRQKQLSSN